MPDQVNGLLSPWLRRKRMQAVLPYLQGKVLDYGCGTGSLAQFCNIDSYLGLDVDKESIAVAKSNYPNYRFELEIPESEMFDTIVLLAVIEHISQPDILLEKLRQSLSYNGSIILTTPAPLTENVHKIGSRIGLFSKSAEEEHEELIGFRKMKAILDKTKLKIVAYEKFLFGANQIFQIQKE